MYFKHGRRYLDIFGWLCVSMECIEFSLDSKIFKVMEARHKKTVMSDWNGERNVRGWLARTAVQHLESRTQGEQNQRPDLIQRCLALIWPFYWLKDWMIWLRLLCNMWRLWLYKLSEVTGRRRRRARAEFEKARRSLLLMQRDLKMMHFYTLYMFVCSSAMHKFLSCLLDCEWQLVHHDYSPCCRRFKAAQKIQAPVTQGWCMNSSSRKLHFAESIFLKTPSLQTSVGWNKWNLPSRVY